MRAFIAIPLPTEAVDALERAQADLACGRVVPAENLHITLAFLDEQPEPLLHALHEGLAEIEAPAFEWRFGGVEAKGKSKPSLVWASVEACETLITLQKSILSAVFQTGITLPRIRFRPHVTLARFGARAQISNPKLAQWLTEYGAYRAGPYAATRFCLYRSTLTPEGPIYDELAAYHLRDGVAASSLGT
ncbi:MAG: RNA 2',3'-cyclic phosphodiesterase [Pseudomonadota bacterium]